MKNSNLPRQPGEERLQKLQQIILEMIYGKFFSTVRALAEKYAQGQVDPRDVIQELALSLLSKDLKTLEEAVRIGMPYIYRCLKNKAIDLIRKKKIRQGYNKRFGERLPLMHDEEGKMAKADKMKLTALLIKRLKPKPRNVVQLVLEGYNNLEIADLLNLNPKTVSTIKNRGIEQLRTFLS